MYSTLYKAQTFKMLNKRFEKITKPRDLRKMRLEAQNFFQCNVLNFQEKIQILTFYKLNIIALIRDTYF